MAGETNQMKVALEEQLLELSQIVVEEGFRMDGADAAAKSAVDDVSKTRSTRTLSRVVARQANDESALRRGRVLMVESATSATVDSVQECCTGFPSSRTISVNTACPDETNLNSNCLIFNNTILLYVINEPLAAEKVTAFESAMLAKIQAGWLKQNFDTEEALMPPVNNMITDAERIQPSARLSAGAIVGLVLGVLLCFLATVLFAGHTLHKRKIDAPPGNYPSDYDLERRAVPFKGSSDAAALDELEAPPLASDGEDSEVHTAANRLYNSQDPLLASNQPPSSAAALKSQSAMSSMPLLGRASSNGGDEPSFYSVASAEGKKEDDDLLTEDDFCAASPRSRASLDATPLAAMAAASTLVTGASLSTKSPENFTRQVTSNCRNVLLSDDDNSIKREFNAVACATTGGRGTTATAKDASSAELTGAVCVLVGTRSVAPQQDCTQTSHDSGKGEFAVGAAAAGAGDEVRDGLTIGADGLVGARTQCDKDDSQVDATSSAASFAPSVREELDNAIGSGNWGHVGALAAVLASQRHGSHKIQSSRSASSGSGLPSSIISPSKSDDSSHRSDSRNSHSGGASSEQARAAEIDRLVESGDWQGVVLAAAKFEADQTFDGESSFSPRSGATSESDTGRWTGSATSATSPWSKTTTSKGTSNVSSQRGLAEIRTEVEALVRRVVPEEVDNIDVMLTQFKGREEELVETLRRMQERAIASRARLAVQKSAKLGAKAKAAHGNRRGMLVSSVGTRSNQSVVSASTTKSELEQAIDMGDWQVKCVIISVISTASCRGALSIFLLFLSGCWCRCQKIVQSVSGRTLCQ